MKTLGIVLLILGVIGLVGLIWFYVYADYQWNNEVLSNWSLSDKSSTLEAKAGYIDKFVQALKSNNLADNNALIYKTADNNCQKNIEAVSTLKQRLDEIKTMNPSSFEYQQAIQQITAQEQGEANAMVDTLNGCWMKTHYYALWNLWLNLLWIILIVLFTVGGIIIIVEGGY